MNEPQDGARVPLPVFGGRYTLFDEIARGGTATVHVARLIDPSGFSRTVAIKRLHSQLSKNAEFVEMFLDEAQMSARIRHPNVAQTLDVICEDGEVFVVMEYLSGATLSALGEVAAHAGARMPTEVAVAIAAGVALGLHAAHETKNERGEPMQLVHRDVSPQNVMVGVDGIPRLLDFGIAKAIGRRHETRDGKIKGKLSYMPPEQLAGGEISRASDIYAAGVVLWELLAGRRLFDDADENTLVARVLEGDIDPPSRFATSVSRELDDLVMRALDRDPARRYASAREMARALEAHAPAPASAVGAWVESVFGHELSIAAERVAAVERRSSPRDLDGTDPKRRVIPIGLPAPAAKRSRRGPLVAAVISALVLGAAVVTWRSRPPSPMPVAQTKPAPAPVSAPASAPTEVVPAELAEPAPQPPSPPLAPRRKADVASRRPEPKAAAPTPTDDKCDPPYWTDDQFHRHYKAQCMR